MIVAGDAEEVLEGFVGHADTAAGVRHAADIAAAEDAAKAATSLAQRWQRQQIMAGQQLEGR
jgi:hypothetical protein